jgi:UDP-glucose 4-epimerase
LAKIAVAVTGAQGYVGSHTAHLLKSAGYKVIAVDWAPSRVPPTCYDEFISGDFADTQILDYLDIQGVKYIVHCAATSLVGPSNSDPAPYYENNISRLVTMLTHVKTWTTKPMIIFSSSASVYGSPTQIPVNESAELRPCSVYGETKKMAETILADYYVAYGIPAVMFRYFNAAGAEPELGLGPGLDDTHLIPQLILNPNFCLYGNNYATEDGTQVRDYVHVADIARAHLIVMQAHQNNEVQFGTYNIGTNSGYSNQTVIDAVKQWIPNLQVRVAAPRDGDPAVLVSDASQFHKKFNWFPENSNINTIVESTVEWYKGKTNG